MEVRTPQRIELGPKIRKEAWKEDWRQNKEEEEEAESKKKTKDTARAGNW